MVSTSHCKHYHSATKSQQASETVFGSLHSQVTQGATSTIGNAIPASLPDGLHDAVAGSSQPITTAGAPIENLQAAHHQSVNDQAANPGSPLASELPTHGVPPQPPEQRSLEEVSLCCTESFYLHIWLVGAASKPSSLYKR